MTTEEHAILDALVTYQEITISAANPLILRMDMMITKLIQNRETVAS